jgi:hypothetical protein
LRHRPLSRRCDISGILIGRSSKCRSWCVASELAFVFGAHSEYGHPDAKDRGEANANYDFAD